MKKAILLVKVSSEDAVSCINRWLVFSTNNIELTKCIKYWANKLNIIKFDGLTNKDCYYSPEGEDMLSYLLDIDIEEASKIMNNEYISK